MFCPECGAEYRVGFDLCTDCGVALINDPPVSKTLASEELITVLETGDVSAVLAARSLLDSAEIPYFAKGDRLQDLFGLGRLGTGFNIVTGPVEIQVSEEHEEEARRILAGLESEEEDVGDA